MSSLFYSRPRFLVIISKLFEMQNTDGRLILTAEVAKNKMAKTSKIYFNKFTVDSSGHPRDQHFVSVFARVRNSGVR